MGEMIRHYRVEAGLTQKKLAGILRIPYQSIGQWERNLRTPKFETVQLLAHALGVSWMDLYPDSSDEDSLLYQGVNDDGRGGWAGGLSDDWIREEAVFNRKMNLRRRLLKAYGALNDADRRKAVEMIEQMVENRTGSSAEDLPEREGGD